MGWSSRSKQSADCARWTESFLQKSAARRGPFDSRGSRSTRDRPRQEACEAGVAGLWGAAQEERWWAISRALFQSCIKASAEVRGVVDARLAVRQQDRRRDDSQMTARRGVFCFSNTSKKHGQPRPRYRSTRGADLEAQIAPVAQLLQHRPGSSSLWQQPLAVQTQLRAYVRCIWVLGCFHRDGRAAQRPLSPIGPHSVARARAVRALGAAMAVDGRFVPRHPRGGVGGAARRDAPAGFGRGCGRQLLLLGLWSIEGCLRRWAGRLLH